MNRLRWAILALLVLALLTLLSGCEGVEDIQRQISEKPIQFETIKVRLGQEILLTARKHYTIEYMDVVPSEECSQSIKFTGTGTASDTTFIDFNNHKGIGIQKLLTTDQNLWPHGAIYQTFPLPNNEKMFGHVHILALYEFFPCDEEDGALEERAKDMARGFKKDNPHWFVAVGEEEVLLP